MRNRWMHLGLVGVMLSFLTQCVPLSRGSNLGGPTEEAREAAISSEPQGDFYYGRRYFVEKTRFWGYVRKPRQSWNRAKLVMMNESRKQVPDRFPEDGPDGRRYGQDANHEYRLRGYFTGRNAYDPNSDQILPEFMLTDYDLLDRQPGWLFRPDDRYDPYRITMLPR